MEEMINAALEKAETLGCTSIVFPAIGTGKLYFHKFEQTFVIPLSACIQLFLYIFLLFLCAIREKWSST